MQEIFELTSTMDAADRMQRVAASSTIPLFDVVTGSGFHDTSSTGLALASIPAFRTKSGREVNRFVESTTWGILIWGEGNDTCESIPWQDQVVYEFVRVTLGIKMHGFENFTRCSNGLGEEDVAIGQNVSLIYEARYIRFYMYGCASSRFSFTGYSRWKDASCRRSSI
jgi:phenylalanine ammonia-lyase